MPARGPENNGGGHLLPLLVSTLLGLASAGIVFYFSSERSALDELQKSVTATAESVHMLKQEVDMNKARRDEQLDEISARLEHRR